LRSAYRSLLPEAGPHRGSTFHTYELRPGWVPSRPRGRRCSHGWLRISSRRQPHPSGNVPTPRCCFHRPRFAVTRHHRGFTCVHPFGLPLACSPRMERDPWASPRSSTPRRYQRRTSGWGQALSTGPGLRSRHRQSTLLSASPLATCDLVSHFWRGVRRRCGCDGLALRLALRLHSVYTLGMGAEETTTVRVRRPDSERLQSIAKSRQTTVVEVVHSAVEALDRQEFLRGLGEDYRRLREDQERWEAYQAERQEWDPLG